MEFLAGSLLELITQTSTNLPPDVRAAMSAAAVAETPGTQSSQALDIILSNIDMAADDDRRHLPGHGHADVLRPHAGGRESDPASKKAILEAVAEATRLRQAAAQFGGFAHRARTAATTWATETPVIHFEQWEEDEIEVKLILKGGGCENKNIQYSRALRAGPPGPRGPQPGRRAQVHPARRVAGAGAGLRARRARRLHRQRPRARLRPGQGAAVPHAGRRESRSRRWPSWKPRSWRRPTSWASARWASAARCR